MWYNVTKKVKKGEKFDKMNLKNKYLMIIKLSKNCGHQVAMYAGYMESINDADMVLLARDIAKQIEAELEYPGQIKVNVIRESRAVDYAK